MKYMNLCYENQDLQIIYGDGAQFQTTRYFPNLTTDTLKSREGNRKQPPAGEWLHVVKFNRLKIQLTNSTITINGQKLYWAHGTPTIISLRVWSTVEQSTKMWQNPQMFWK